METGTSNGAPQAAPPASRSVAKRWTYAVLALAFLFVLMPFLFWQSTWFGRPLDDEDLAENFADREKPRKTQHALAQIGERIVRNDPEVKRWYPQVVESAKHPVDEIRVTAAWVMGQDNTATEFQFALGEMLNDSNPMVRRNAALSLVRFADDSGHAELLAMLAPFAVTSPSAGQLKHRLRIGDSVNPGTLLARIQQGGEEVELRSPVPGTVHRWVEGNGAEVTAGAAIIEVAPSAEMVWEALRALHLVGRLEDLPAVERYASAVAGMPPHVAQQAAETARAIRARAEANP